MSQGPVAVAVIDIGKTNVKLALVDPVSLNEIAVVTRPNDVLTGPPWPHFDVEGHWDFFLENLAAFQTSHGVAAVSVATHGASVVLIDQDGGLAAPILDYEHDGPEDLASAYDRIRPPFAETGSPRLALGLNVGAQLHWQLNAMAGLRERVALVLTYPQYWGYRLTGVAASDVTSLGCHTDLWNPFRREPSGLLEQLGLGGRLAPPRTPGESLGPLLPEIAQATGLPAHTPVLCGIHDSNASLLPHLLTQSPPFSVISTGTWVIAMAIGGQHRPLAPERDTLVNVNAFGDPVPSARFMGGREYDLLMQGREIAPDPRAIAAVAHGGQMLLPAVVPETGPFPGRRARWIAGELPVGTAERTVAVGFYLALMSAECLDLIGHRGPIHVEGPFACNASYLRMLASATGCDVYGMPGMTGTSQGAALLGQTTHPAGPELAPAITPDKGLAHYAETWRGLVGSGARPA
ncbi:MAG: FGGY-family carbohydrate kinase [Pseudomonadota bacterium]